MKNMLLLYVILLLKYVEEGEVIDDIVQDVFVCLWEKRVDFKTEETIKAFLYKGCKK